MVVREIKDSVEQKIELEVDDSYGVMGWGFFGETGVMFPVFNALSGFIFHFICVDYAPETLVVWHCFEFPDFRTFLISGQMPENLNKIA